jgi:hypothetical protein
MSMNIDLFLTILECIRDLDANEIGQVEIALAIRKGDLEQRKIAKEKLLERCQDHEG